MHSPIRRLVAIVVIGGVTLVACGSDDVAEPADDPAVTEAAGSAAPAEDAPVDAADTSDQTGDDAASDGGEVALYGGPGSALVIFDDVTYEFEPTGDPFSCYVDGNAGIAQFDGVSAAGDVLYIDYDNADPDLVLVSVETVDPSAAWYFGTDAAGEVNVPDVALPGARLIQMSGDMTSSVTGTAARNVIISAECS